MWTDIEKTQKTINQKQKEEAKVSERSRDWKEGEDSQAGIEVWCCISTPELSTGSYPVVATADSEWTLIGKA